jgi:hypothetical protein
MYGTAGSRALPKSDKRPSAVHSWFPPVREQKGI